MTARKLIFPGVGAYASAMEVLKRKGLIDPVKEYVQSGRSFLGICLGLQLLFDGSEENDGVEGLGIIPGTVAKFDTSLGLPVPHIGWNGETGYHWYLQTQNHVRLLMDLDSLEVSSLSVWLI